MPRRQTIGTEDTRRVAVKLGLDLAKAHPGQLDRARKAGLKHAERDVRTDVTDNDLVSAGKIAWARIEEFPDYYMRLERLAMEAGTYPAPRGSSAPAGSLGCPEPVAPAETIRSTPTRGDI